MVRPPPPTPLPRPHPSPRRSRLHPPADLRRLHDYNPDYAPTTGPTTPLRKGKTISQSLDGPRPDASHYELAQVYVTYGSLPPADHAHLLALLAITDALRTLTDQPTPDPQPTHP
ncbi:hypothetical protein [Kitasatospora sp. NPDC088779]|uniref:hypothetical protein n=1 Tax=Kitasatospora sp. NPDC088779 TaxID=3154964 RepID=UPI00341B5D7A